MWAIRIENYFSLGFVENGRVQSATLRPIIVDGASLAVMKDASPRQILELSTPILIDDEVFLGELEVPYSDDI
jgi:hypothetical protein